MANFKEIVTKAIIGKSKKNSTNEFKITPELKPDTILGCWIINHKFNGVNNNGLVNILGTYDINVWYSYDSDTKTAVTTKSVDYQDKMPVRLKDNSILTNNEEIIVRSLKQPSVSNVTINGDTVDLVIEKELGVEVIGDTKIKVSIEEDEDDYEEINDDEVMSSHDEVAIDEIDEEYLK
ncbi:MAG: outer spore coat protein CotE [Bacilli bacterium]|nr:outer spore coat protein CotE [Bacilli bacterium]